MNRKIVLAFGLLLIAVLACNTPQAATTQPPPPPPPTVTPFILATEGLPAATPTTESAGQPTREPAQTVQPPATVGATVTPTARPATTPTPQPPTVSPSAGPLDFGVPEWIDGYDPLPEGRYRVYVTIHISGGAPPFTVLQEGQVVAESWQRDIQFNFERGGCAAIVYTITVNSADGQTISHDYWIGTDKQPWCSS